MFLYSWHLMETNCLGGYLYSQIILYSVNLFKSNFKLAYCNNQEEYCHAYHD